MSTRKAWVLYSLIRIGLFVGLYTLIFLLSGIWWFSAIAAALMSMAISVLALDKLRRKASEGFYEWRNKTHTEDSLVEDEIIELNPEVLERKSDRESNSK